MTESAGIVIVGGGHSAAQLCSALVDGGVRTGVHLVCEEVLLPYQRPPLSMGFLKQPTETVQLHRGDGWFAEHGIEVHRGDRAVAVGRGGRRLLLQSGSELAYERLVLATGTRARRIEALGTAIDNVAVLRSADDAMRLRSAMAAVPSITVLGGGFIGLEIAATARALGKSVVVLEAASRLMGRSVSSALAEHVLEVHRGAGIDVRVGVKVDGFVLEERWLKAMSVDGGCEAVDLLVLGIGAVPDTTLAEQAGLACEDGILVDAFMQTSDTAILAIGDCTRFPAHELAPSASGRLRLESVQNANDQARTAACTLLGRPTPYRALPWFWSEQGSMRLQMAGLATPTAATYRRSGARPDSFSLLHYVGDRLCCVESVNAPLDHMAARKLIEQGANPEPQLACDPSVSLKTLG